MCRARDALMQLFGVAAGSSSRRRYSTIIVLDEIDMLMTKDQAVREGHSALLWEVAAACPTHAACGFWLYHFPSAQPVLRSKHHDAAAPPDNTARDWIDTVAVRD